MMQAREKTRENQFVQPNTVSVALAVLMNYFSFSFYLSFFCFRLFFLSTLGFISPKDYRFFARLWPLVKYVRTSCERSEVRKPLKTPRLNMMDVVPIICDVFYFTVPMTKRHVTILIQRESSSRKYSEERRRSILKPVCFMKIYHADNFLMCIMHRNTIKKIYR